MSDNEDKKEYFGKDVRKIIKVGTSVAITLPREYVDIHGLKPGDKMDLYFDEILHIEPIKEKEIAEKLGKKIPE